MSELGGGADFGGQAFLLFGQGAEVAFDLDAVPELGRLGEEGTETDGHGRGDGALAENDLVNGSRCHADGAGHGILRDAHGLKVFLQKYLTGGDGRVHAHNV